MAKISLSYPDTGLTISISVKNRDTGVEDFTGTMTEVGTTREYKYDFAEVMDTDYVYVATVTGYSPMSGVIYRVGGGLTTEEHDRLFTLPTSAGGGSINYQAINSHTTNKVNELKEELVKLPKIIEDGLNETNYHIDIVKTEVISTIESIEIPKSVLEEKEAKKAIKLLTTLDKKVSSYIDSEMNDKEELGAIAKQFGKLEMEDAMKEKEKEIEHKKMMEEKQKMEEEEDKKMLEEIKSEFDKRDEMEKEEKRKELEKELEETLKEAEEIKKELKII